MRKALAACFTLALLASPASARSFAGDLLLMHNVERQQWGVGPLTWDPVLAAAADQWAVELARTGRWGHSPKALRGSQGENLWMGTRGAYSLNAMVGGWVSERRWFRPSVFPGVSRTGRWSDVGHYTQMVARRTTRVGCAIRSSRNWDYLVCRYNPPGNVDGSRIV
jgi:hypothetical protein